MEENNQFPNQPESQENLHPGLIVLSFCIPLAGAIIYFINKDNAPKKAQTACYSALAGFAIALVSRVILIVAEGS